MIADLNGKGDHIRTVPMSNWVKTAIDDWATLAGINSGPSFEPSTKREECWGNGFTPKVIRSIVYQFGSMSAWAIGHQIQCTLATSDEGLQESAM